MKIKLLIVVTGITVATAYLIATKKQFVSPKPGSEMRDAITKAMPPIPNISLSELTKHVPDSARMDLSKHREELSMAQKSVEESAKFIREELIPLIAKHEAEHAKMQELLSETEALRQKLSGLEN